MKFNSGKLRSARNSLMGVKGIPDDAFADDRSQIAKTERFAKVFQETADHFDNKLSKVASANDTLIAALNDFFDQHESYSLYSLKQARVRSSPKLEALRVQVQSFRSSAKSTEESLKDRDKKYWDRQHYEDKVAKFTDEERLNPVRIERNIKKRSKAITEFAETEKSLREAQIVADSIPDAVDSFITLYSDYLVEFFTHADQPGGANGEPKLKGSNPVTPSRRSPDRRQAVDSMYPPLPSDNQ
jgi:hypothetical protein